MGYTTQAAESLVDTFQRQSAMNADKAKHQTEAFDRGLRTGYADAFALAAEWATRILPVVENEARIVPEYEVPDPVEWLKGQMAGDLRDFPA